MKIERVVKICSILIVVATIITCKEFLTFVSKFHHLFHSNALTSEEQRVANFYQKASYSEERESETSLVPVDIFYHIYVPPNDPEGANRSYDILEEQMNQIFGEKSSGVYGRENVTFNYVTIGQAFNETFVTNLCDKYELECTHVSHYDKGFEMLTQQIILDFCNQEENDLHLVTYIHSKGALNPSPEQIVVRGFLTSHAVSDQCIHRLSNDQCNVCGGNFRSVWGPMFWGNMWSAQCNYVKNLISPNEIEEKYDIAMQTRPEGIEMTLFKGENFKYFSLAKGRYAAELFVSSHPGIIPCSMMQGSKLYWSEDPPGDFTSHVVGFVEMELLNKMIMGTSNAHLKEWYLLPGILWRYHVLYNELPPADSWVWRHYPDGIRWNIAIQQMGFPQALYHRIETET